MKILQAFLFGRIEQPSTRFRFAQFEPWIRQHFEVHARNARPGLQDVLGASPHEHWLVQKRLPPWSVLQALRWRRPGRLVYDFDDAIWTSPRGDWSPSTRWRTLARLHAVFRRADVVLAANAYLAAYARQQGARVEVLPMSLPVAPTPLERHARGPLCIGWGGHPQSHYLLGTLIEPLKAVLRDNAGRLRFVLMSGSTRPDLPFDFEYRPWSPENETAFFDEVDVGLVPVNDTAFDRGKSPIKILQHFSRAASVITNGQGATLELATAETAWRVDGPHAWAQVLRQALADRQQVIALGRAGHALALARHDVNHNAARLMALLENTTHA